MKASIWLIIGVVLGIAEIFIPGQILMWFGIGALSAALFAWLGIIEQIPWQILYFSVSSLGMILVYHLWIKKAFVSEKDQSRDPTLYDLRGKVTKAIEPGMPGRVMLNSPHHGVSDWKAESEFELKKGDEILVKEADGIKLIVEPFNKDENKD